MNPVCGKCVEGNRLELKKITEADGEIRWSCPKHGKLTEDIPLTQPEPLLSFIDYVPEEQEEGQDELTEEPEEEEEIPV